MRLRLLSVALLLSACSDDGGGGVAGGTGGVASGGAGGSSGGGGTGGKSVSIVSPGEGATVSGSVSIELAVSGNVGSVTVSAQGKTVCTLSAAPWKCTWDTGTAHDNPLAAPDHAFDFGYYFVDGKYGDHRSTVDVYTNLYLGLGSSAYDSSAPWAAPFTTSLAQASASKRKIFLSLGAPDDVGAILDIAAPHWSDVAYLELADEPPWTQAETESAVANVLAGLSSRGLAPRPIGAVYTQNQVLTGDAIFASGLDWIGLEAYVAPPGDASPDVNAKNLETFLTAAKARVPADKKLVVVMQAYDRNGQWTNEATLAKLQTATYELVRDEPRLLALTMFAYGRPGGTHDHPSLGHEHQLMAERILGINVPALSNGPATVSAVAGSLSDQANVTIAN